jgi:hypothetical protein
MSAEILPLACQPDYLTDALRRADVLDGGSVRDVAVESSRQTILSRILRLRLTYDRAPDQAPGSLILKTGLPERAALWKGGNREISFYRQIAAATPRATVLRCYDAEWDASTGDWHLLLEDLTDTHATPGEWPLPPTRAQCEHIVGAWARFHAAWWDDPRLGVLIGTWLDPDDAQLRVFAERVDRFAERLGDRLSPERGDFYRRLLDAGPHLNRRYHSHRHMTIVHGDSHVWNVFLPQNGDGNDVRLFDWDGWRVDTATDDLAYMMALHWFPEYRHRYERHLLDRYHAALLARGVVGYDRGALEDDYRLSVLWQAATPVWQATNDLPAWIWWPHLDRIFTAIDDLGCRELL